MFYGSLRRSPVFKGFSCVGRVLRTRQHPNVLEKCGIMSDVIELCQSWGGALNKSGYILGRLTEA